MAGLASAQAFFKGGDLKNAQTQASRTWKSLPRTRPGYLKPRTSYLPPAGQQLIYTSMERNFFMSRMRLRAIRLAAAASALVAIALPSAAFAQSNALSDPQKKAVEQIVRDYLLANPEVIQEAIVELERRQQEAQKTSQKNALDAERKTLLSSPHGNVVGNPSGDVTLVEFFDYNCAYCKRALADLRTLMKSDPKLRVVLKDFPVLGPESVEASRVALAVKQQISGDKLFDYHVRLMESRGRINGERALGVAKEMGLDMARLQKDMGAPDVQAALQENVGLGDKLGLTGTPAFIIGEEVISGAVGLDPIRKVVASTRQCGKATC
jgi:protein-disulfide isomerase